MSTRAYVVCLCVCVLMLLTFDLLGLGTFNPFSGDPLPANPKKQLILKVISGQQLPKPPDSMFGDRGEVSVHLTASLVTYEVTLLWLSSHLCLQRHVCFCVLGGMDICVRVSVRVLK